MEDRTEAALLCKPARYIVEWLVSGREGVTSQRDCATLGRAREVARRELGIVYERHDLREEGVNSDGFTWWSWEDRVLED